MSVALQADGKIVVAGFAPGQARDFALVRYNADGTLDTSFSGDGKVVTAGVSNDVIQDVAVLADGKILAMGYSDHANIGSNTRNLALVRYNSDGSLDTSYGSGGVSTPTFSGSLDTFYKLQLLSDGKVLVGGVTSFNGGPSDFVIMRLNANGSLDTSFGTGGRVVTSVSAGADGIYSLALQADGKIVATGFAENGATLDVAVVRYLANGTLDTSFGNAGKLVMPVGSGNETASGVAVVGDQIVFGGTTGGAADDDVFVGQLNSDGSLNMDFGVPRPDALSNSVSYTENGAPVALYPFALVHDVELAAQGNYAGATLTLARQGGASSEEVFSGTGTLSFAGGNAVVSGVTIGSVSNNAGTLSITFNSSATALLVDQALRSIGYSNTSDTPPSQVEIGWTFSDGNTGAQGSGGALTATRTTTVSITAVNDAPVNSVMGIQSLADDLTLWGGGYDTITAEGKAPEESVSFSLLPEPGAEDVIGLTGTYPGTDYFL